MTTKVPFQLLANGTAGELITWSAAGAPDVIAAGASGQVLTSNGAGAAATFQAAGGGSSTLVLLATATASASASLNFTSLISSSYNSYYFVFENLLNSTSASVGLRASIDNGSTWAVTFTSQKHYITLGGTTAPSYTGVSAATPALLTTASSSHNRGYAFLVNPTNIGLWESSLGDASPGNIAKTFLRTDTNNTNAVSFLPSAGTFTSGKIFMYGIKNT